MEKGISKSTLAALARRKPAKRYPEIDAALAEALEDVRAGRLFPAFSSMKEFKAWRKTPEGKRFGEGPLPRELEALDEAEAEFVAGKTRRLEDVLRDVGRKTKKQR